MIYSRRKNCKMRIRRSLISILLAAAMASAVMAGCGSSSSGGDAAETPAADTAATETPAAAETAEAIQPAASALEDGEYVATFQTGSTMFYVNEADHGTGILTVEDGRMTIHIRLVSQSIVNLYPGTKDEAQADDAALLEPTVETVTYEDGMTDEVNAYDVPVPYLDQEFPVSIIGTHGNWYEHQVVVSLVDEAADGNGTTDEDVSADGSSVTAPDASVTSVSELEDGTYEIAVALEGGSGRASVTSPTTLTVENGAGTAVIEWDSPNYDYMVVNGETYYPVNDGGNSVFEIPVEVFGEPMDVVGDTTAMSQPHEIDYTLTFTVG